MQSLGTIDNQYTILDLYESESQLFSVKHNETQTLYLIEVINKEVESSLNIPEIIECLKKLNHPNFFHYLSDSKGSYTYKDKKEENCSYIVYKHENLKHYNLEDYIRNKNGFSEKQAKLILKKILEGLKAMHNLNICHRDLKPSKILFDENYNLKISVSWTCCLNSENLDLVI